MDYDFEKWWKNYGLYLQEVVDNLPELEESFKHFGYKVWKEALRKPTETYYNTTKYGREKY
jgi:hypothetical protein